VLVDDTETVHLSQTGWIDRMRLGAGERFNPPLPTIVTPTEIEIRPATEPQNWQTLVEALAR
jgi:hypothetical protein